MSVAASSWRCPSCHASTLRERADGLLCEGCGVDYPSISGRPLLIRPDNELFGAHCDADLVPAPGRRWAPSLSVNLSREPCLHDLARRLAATHSDTTVLLVGSGGQRREIARLLAQSAPSASIGVVACDVSPAAALSAKLV